MNQETLFSVLIANYNNKKYLQECIDSIKKQTYHNWECIIVDDCSTDNPFSLYNHLEKDNRINIYYNKKNKGTGYTFRKCQEHSNGEICGMLGPDDTLDETAIEKMVRKHEELTDYSLIYSLNYLCNDKLQKLNNTICGGPLKNNESQLSSSGNNKITSFATYKTYHYKLTEGIDPSFKRAVDQDFYYKMEEVGPVYCLEEPLYFYRIHKNNISRNQNSNKAMYWKYIADKHAYDRRKGKKLKVKNISFGELQRRYIDVCLRKIQEKILAKEYKNLCYYYLQLLKLIVWDRNLKIVNMHILLMKRFIKNLIND